MEWDAVIGRALVYDRQSEVNEAGGQTSVEIHLRKRCVQSCTFDCRISLFSLAINILFYILLFLV